MAWVGNSQQRLGASGDPTPGRSYAAKLRWLVLLTALLFVWSLLRAAGYRHEWLSVSAACVLCVYLPAVLAHTLVMERRWARHELADSLQGRRLRAIDRTSDELSWEVDADGTVVYIGPHLERLLGYRPDEIIGKPMYLLVPECERSRAHKLIATCLEPACGWQDLEFTYLTKDGQRRMFLSSAVAFADSDGRATGFAGTLRQPALAAAQIAVRETRQRIEAVLQHGLIESVFQPIVDSTSGVVLGAESLSRFQPDGLGLPPDAWFAEAYAVGLGTELELLALESALIAARDLPNDIYVSVNLSPAALLTGQLGPIIDRTGWCPVRLVLEVTEHVSVENYEPLRDCLADLRRAGLRLAVDDAGAGYASFRHILALAPDYIKLDRSLIAEVNADPSRRALVSAVITFAGEVGATVIAEGVETPAELATLRQLGVQAAQGFLSGRPVSTKEWLESTTALTPSRLGLGVI